MKMKLLLLLGALFFTPLTAAPKEYPNWFTGQGYTPQVISPCKHCGYKAPNPAQLKKHIYIVHTRKLPFFWKCNFVGCDKTFKTNKELMWHIDSGDHDIKKEKLHKGCGCRS